MFIQKGKGPWDFPPECMLQGRRLKWERHGPSLAQRTAEPTAPLQEEMEMVLQAMHTAWLLSSSPAPSFHAEGHHASPLQGIQSKTQRPSFKTRENMSTIAGCETGSCQLAELIPASREAAEGPARHGGNWTPPGIQCLAIRPHTASSVKVAVVLDSLMTGLKAASVRNYIQISSVQGGKWTKSQQFAHFPSGTQS